MLSSKIGHSLDPLIYRFYLFIFGGKILSPNIISFLGFIAGIFSFLSLIFNAFYLSGIFLLVSGFFDMVDGALARNTKKSTAFGGFLDSVLDRYVDLAIAFGIFINFIKKGEHDFAILTFFAAIGIVLVSYTKARAESSSLSCNTGLFERPERTIVILFGLFFDLLKVSVILLAIFSHITVIQRILFVRAKEKTIKGET